MTIEEAIRNRERCLQYLEACGPNATPENVEAVKLSIAALREKAERENPRPLTLEELRQMHGEPVWMEDEKVWGIIDVDEYGQWKNKPFITFYWKSVRCNWNIEVRGLTCYRNKPKEGPA